MSSEPLVVVGSDNAQLDHLMAEARRVMDGWTISRFPDAHGRLAVRHAYFLFLPQHARFMVPDPSQLRGVSFLSLGEQAGLPLDAEIFPLGSADGPAVVPLLHALAHRERDVLPGAHDEAVAEVARALTAETADLERVLMVLCRALDASRVTMFELRGGAFTADATHEWCADPMDSLIRAQPAMDRRTGLWVLPRINLNHSIRIDDIAALPFTAFEERVLSNARNMQAVLISALRSPRGSARGAIMAERTKAGRPWTDEGERLLLVCGEMVANYLDRKSVLAQAREEGSIHHQVLDQIHDGVFMASAEGGGFSFVSPPAARMWGMTVDELMLGADIWKQVVHPEDLPRVRSHVRARTESAPGQEQAIEFRILRADDGCERWIRLRSFPVHNMDGRVERLAGLLEDITEQRERHTRLRLLARVFETTGEAVVITDPDSCIIDVNPAFTRITGYSRQEVLGRNPRVMSSGRHDREFYTEMWQSLVARGHWRGEIWDRRKDGSEYPKLLTINAIREDDGTVSSYVGVFADITDVKETEARLQRMAHHDALTGLPNRLLFQDRLEQALANACRNGHLLGLIFLDLDGFKQVNDRLGHRAGDQLLVEVARRLREQVRDSDTVARLGGDEFTAILQSLSDRSGAAAVAEKLLSVLARPFEILGHRVEIGASIGISLFPEHACDVDGLVRSADGAMYQAKEAGRNRHCFAATL